MMFLLESLLCLFKNQDIRIVKSNSIDRTNGKID
jgi:hypothetical protein